MSEHSEHTTAYQLIGQEDMKTWTHPQEKEILRLIKANTELKKIRNMCCVCHETVDCVRVKHGMKPFMKKRIRNKKGMPPGFRLESLQQNNVIHTPAGKIRLCRKCGSNAYPNYFYCPKCQKIICGDDDRPNSCMV